MNSARIPIVRVSIFQNSFFIRYGTRMHRIVAGAVWALNSFSHFDII